MPPYRKRYAKRSYGRSRSTSRRRRPMGGTFMKRARTRAYANLRTGGLLAIERKFSDLAYPNTLLGNGTGGAVVSGGDSTFAPPVLAPTQYRSAIGKIFTVAPTALNVLVAGDSGCDRDGRQVINDSIHIRGQVESRTNNDFGAANCAFTVNIVLVLDTQTNGGSPAGGSVFVNPGDLSAASPGDNGAAPFVNLSNSKRFRILKHIRRVQSPSAISGNGTITRAAGQFVFAMDVPLKGMKTNYVSDAAVTGPLPSVACLADNGIFLFAWADTADYGSISFNSRLRFRG